MTLAKQASIIHPAMRLIYLRTLSASGAPVFSRLTRRMISCRISIRIESCVIDISDNTDLTSDLKA
jgi:hypothetical protein